jgi:glycosyl hydrolase family 12
MRQPNHGVRKRRWPHPGQDRYRGIMAVAVAIAFVGLGAYFLSNSHPATPYADTGAENGTSATVSAGNTCTDPRAVPMEPGNAQSGVTRGNYYVTNDSWNVQHYGGLSQTLFVCNYDNWYVTAAMNNDSGDGAVKTSPNVQETWYPTPTKLSRWKSITSRFSDIPPGTGPAYGIWEFEYDIWLNGLADSNSTEVMIWTYNNGQVPSGSPVGTFTDTGQTYVVYRSPPPLRYIAFVGLNDNLSGDLNLSDFFSYAVNKGWMPASSRLYQICHGVELVSTNDKPEKFAVNNFSISMKSRS